MYNLRNIGYVKRFYECWKFVPGFKENFIENPRETLTVGKFPFHPDQLALEENDEGIHAKYCNSVMADYLDFVNDNYDRIDREMEIRTKPQNPKMLKWYENRIEQSIQQGIDRRLYIPLAFELSQGCSVGCPFCGLSADKLSGIFEASSQNVELFEKIVNCSMDIIGPAAGKGILYYATEPLDNPDYEVFANIVFKKTGIIPQITTAVPLRDIKRIKKLLKQLNDNPKSYYRFSVLSVADLFRIYDSYQPEELIYTLIEPRFSETFYFTSTGRQAIRDNNYSGTISCIVGFVVNMYSKTISLRYLCDADKWNPTGEVNLCTVPFRDEIEFEELMYEIIDKKM